MGVLFFSYERLIISEAQRQDVVGCGAISGRLLTREKFVRGHSLANRLHNVAASGVLCFGASRSTFHQHDQHQPARILNSREEAFPIAFQQVRISAVKSLSLPPSIQLSVFARFPSLGSHCVSLAAVPRLSVLLPRKFAP